MSNTINLKGTPIRKEGVVPAGKTFRPGHFIVSVPRQGSDSGAIDFPAVAGGMAQGVVFENELEGKTITDAYVADEGCLYGVWPKGGEVLGRVAAGQAAITRGAELIANTDGCLIPNPGVAAAGTAETLVIPNVVAVAIESVDNSGGGSEAFIKVEIV